MDNHDHDLIQKYGNILTEKTGLRLIIFGAGLILISLIVFLVFGSWKFSSRLDEAKIGQYGDFIGGVVGSIFSLVGVILFYIALKAQRSDFRVNQNAFELQLEALNQQIKEFKAQRDELESTRKIYEQQTKTMKNQQFDSNFYSLLDVYISIKRDLNKLCNGMDYFEVKLQELSLSVEFANGDSQIDFHSKLIDAYSNLFLGNRANLSLYFKTVYRLLRVVDDCEHLTVEEKIFYSKILRSQVTNNELLILYYNYHSSYGERVQQLILKYNFLKHLETLSKVDFSKRFPLDNKNKVELILFTDMVSNLLKKNVALATDIEYVEPIKVEEKYSKYDWIVGVYIDDIIELKIFVDKDSNDILSLSDDEFKMFMYYFLNDEFYFKKFRNPKNDEITKSIIRNDQHLIFQYTINYL